MVFNKWMSGRIPVESTNVQNRQYSLRRRHASKYTLSFKIWGNPFKVPGVNDRGYNSQSKENFL